MNQPPVLDPLDVAIKRCLVLSARTFYEGFLGSRCTSPLQCRHCLSPAIRDDTPCVECGAIDYEPCVPAPGCERRSP